MSARLRIALTHAFCWPEVRRGGERYLHELAAALGRRGHKVTIIAGAEGSSDGTERSGRVIRVARGPADDPQAPARFAAAIRTPLLTHRFDVVHSLGPLDAVASLDARRFRRRRRIVYTNLGSALREWWDTQPEREAHERCVAEVDLYGCLSAYSMELLRRDYGREGAMTPGGVRLAAFVPSAEREPRPTLLYSGALTEPRKCVDILLASLPLIARTEPDMQLWLSGSGDPTALLTAAGEEARSRTTVLPIGEPDGQADRYARAWATVLPSFEEAFGLVLVESLACGTPIVGADHGALPEIVRPGIGALSRVKDPASLAEACCTALSLARRPGIADTCRTVASGYDWDAVVAPQMEAVYLGAR